MVDRPLWWLAAAVMVAMAYTWMAPAVTAPNERSRLYLTLSILDDGDLAIDEQVDQYGTPFDVAHRGDHFYSDKAPGSSIVAVPFLAVYKSLGGSESIEAMTNFCRGFVMLPMALLCVLWLRALVAGIGVPDSTANATAVAFAIGTSFFHYGAAFFGHAMVTLAALGAGVAMLRAQQADSRRARDGWQFLAGFAGAAAFAVEYQAGVICIGIAAAYLSVSAHRRPRAVLMPAVGASIPIALTLAYNYAAFGGALETSYAHLYHNYSQQIHSGGLFGIKLPTFDALYGILLSPSRGILLGAPVVTLGLLGLGILWRRCRWLALYVGISVVGYLVIVSGSEIWYGGWGFGPRLLVPIFGLAAIPGALVLEQSRAWRSAAGIIGGYIVAGMGYNVFVSAMFPEPPESVAAPLPTIAWRMAQADSPSPNLGITCLGLDGMTSLIPLWIIVGLLALYVLADLFDRRRPILGWLLPFAATVLVFATMAIGYPETMSAKKADKFVDTMSSLPVDPK